MADFFRYAVDTRLLAFWLPFGVRQATDGVTLTPDGTFVATFGFLKIETPLSNVESAHVTRNYRWWTAAGARGSFVDDGLTTRGGGKMRTEHGNVPPAGPMTRSAPAGQRARPRRSRLTRLGRPDNESQVFRHLSGGTGDIVGEVQEVVKIGHEHREVNLQVL